MSTPTDRSPVDTLLYYTPGTCALACIVTLEWLGQPYRLCRVDREARSSDAYAAIHPRRQVPAMALDGRILVEANAILQHLAERDPDQELLPRHGFERDLAHQFLASFASGFHAAFWPYFRPDRYVLEATAEPSAKAAAIEAVKRELAAMNAHLAGRTYVLGEKRSVLDTYLDAMDRWANAFLDVPAAYPEVFRHQKMMAQDPAVRFGKSLERDPDAPLTGSACVEHARFTNLTTPA